MTARVTRLVKGLALGAIAAGGLLSVLASPGGGQTGDGTGPGDLHMVIKRAAGPNMLCPTTNVVWELTPGNLTGSNGTSAPLQKSQAYAGGNTGGQAPFECTFTDQTSFTGLRPGPWTLKATTAVPPGGPTTVSCTKTVTQGQVTLFWTFDTTGKVTACQ